VNSEVRYRCSSQVLGGFLVPPSICSSASCVLLVWASRENTIAKVLYWRHRSDHHRPSEKRHFELSPIERLSPNLRTRTPVRGWYKLNMTAIAPSTGSSVAYHRRASLVSAAFGKTRLSFCEKLCMRTCSCYKRAQFFQSSASCSVFLSGFGARHCVPSRP
jgi:hypothetical protein